MSNNFLTLSNYVTDEEILYRAVTLNPIFWKNDCQRPSSALFKDSKGVSVDRDGQRTDNDIIKNFNEKFKNNIKAIVSINAATCRNELNLFLKASPCDDNIYHAEIHNSDKEIQLKSSQARRLSEKVKIIYLNQNIY